MFETFRNAWKIADLRKKILYTLMVIVVFRIGAAIPVPFIDLEALKTLMSSMTGDTGLLGYFNIISGGGLEKATLFALSVTPYINASIIIQLLTVAIPPLERMAKEGEEGRKKIAKYTRYSTIVLGLIQAGEMCIRDSSGPVPLPTDKQVVTILRAVHKYKDSREQFEMRTHKRLIDILRPSNKTVEALTGLELPAGVEIEIQL